MFKDTELFYVYILKCIDSDCLECYWIILIFVNRVFKFGKYSAKKNPPVYSEWNYLWMVNSCPSCTIIWPNLGCCSFSTDWFSKLKYTTNRQVRSHTSAMCAVNASHSVPRTPTTPSCTQSGARWASPKPRPARSSASTGACSASFVRWPSAWSSSSTCTAPSTRAKRPSFPVPLARRPIHPSKNSTRWVAYHSGSLYSNSCWISGLNKSRKSDRIKWIIVKRSIKLGKTQ